MIQAPKEKRANNLSSESVSTTEQSWENLSGVSVDLIFALIENQGMFDLYKGSLMQDSCNIFLGDNHIDNMKSIVDEMISKKIWKYDSQISGYQDDGTKTLVKDMPNLLWETLAACSIMYFRSFDKDINLYSYKNMIKMTLIKKQKDYGPKNIEKFGINGIVIRVYDKIARLQNLILKNQSAQNESIQDTLLDIVGYSAIAIMWNNNCFSTPMSGE